MRNQEPSLPFVHRLPARRPRALRWAVLTLLLMLAAVAASRV